MLVVLALLEGHAPNMELATLILQQCMSNVRRMPSHRGHLPMKPCVSAQSAQAAEAKMLGRLVNVPRSICKRSDVRAARETPMCGNGGGGGRYAERALSGVGAACRSGPHAGCRCAMLGTCCPAQP